MNRQRHLAVLVAAFAFLGLANALLDDVKFTHDAMSVATPWVCLFLAGGLRSSRSAPATFARVLAASLVGMALFYLAKEFVGSGVSPQIALFWVSLAIVGSFASAIVRAIEMSDRTRRFVGAAAGLPVGLAIAEALWILGFPRFDATGSGVTVAAAWITGAAAAYGCVLRDNFRPLASTLPGLFAGLFTLPALLVVARSVF